MKHETPRSTGRKQPISDEHPWKQRARAQVAEREAPKKDVSPRKGWVCPVCEDESCQYGECAGGDF